ncbi:uncharacterized protein [Aegilops tauschii subsp. strangulata]|uniref:uncharacterized protein n=1 Tax=Aegilops tauschii subsp. strangulata TaxID=200361 RepID=UPI003CC88A35
MSLATGEVRAHRNMATDDTCPICNAAVDTWRHALIECNMSRAVWALADDEVVEHLIMNRTDDARLWIFWLFDTMKENELATTLVTLWAIWWARRRAIHDEEFHNPISTFGFITKYLEEIEVPMKQKRAMKPDAHEARHSRLWSPLKPGWCKVSVDGGLSRDGRRGAAAAICRDERGHFLGASAVVLNGQTNSACLEAIACNEGFALAQDLNIRKIKVASDCLEVVTNFQKKAKCSYSVILREVEDRAKLFTLVEAVHEYREFVVDAHRLAKAASSLGAGRYIWLGSLPDIYNIPLNVSIE